MCMTAGSACIEWFAVTQSLSLWRGKRAEIIISCVVQGGRCRQSGYEVLSGHCAYVLSSSLSYFAHLVSLDGVPKRMRLYWRTYSNHSFG